MTPRLAEMPKYICLVSVLWETEFMHPQDETSLLVELDRLIEEYGGEACASDFVVFKASEGLSRVIQAAMDDISLRARTLAGMREAMVNGLTARLIGEGAIDEDDEGVLLETKGIALSIEGGDPDWSIYFGGEASGGSTASSALRSCFWASRSRPRPPSATSNSTWTDQTAHLGQPWPCRMYHPRARLRPCGRFEVATAPAAPRDGELIRHTPALQDRAGRADAPENPK